MTNPVKNDKNKIMVTFGRFQLLDVACAATGLLIKYDWNINLVKNDSIYRFNDKFYVFKVVNNQLMFDSNYDSFEKAVETFEINYRCNDYHNDIFKTSINQKKGYEEEYTESEQDDEIETDSSHIFQKNGKFIVKKSKMKNSLTFGKFNSFKEAQAALKILVDCKWKISDGTEITLFNNEYYVFEINDGVINYLGKSDSYEDTFEIINPTDYDKKPKDDLDSRIEEFYKRKQKQKKKVKKSVAGRDNLKSSVKKLSKRRAYLKNAKVWRPLIRNNNLKSNHYNFIIVHSTKKEDKLVAIFDLKVSGSQIICSVDDVEIPWKKRFNSDLNLFPEFELIVNIFETNCFNISKINQSSSIYFFNDLYYKIKIIDGNYIIFNTFESYAKAERSKLVYKRMPIADFIPPSIDKVRGKYEVVKISGGHVLKIRPLKSLESIKAICDILIHFNWDITELNKYDLFYLNGLYWELKFQDYEIFLIKKYEFI